MSTKNNDQGHAFELACINALKDAIAKYHSLSTPTIEENSALQTAVKAWKNTDKLFQTTAIKAAKAMTEKLIELEPMLSENDQGDIVLKLQKDAEGEHGDVRDILILCGKSGWEIGLSVKHNHFAIKHSRLSPTIDFGSKWYGVPCSSEYKDEITPIFDYLKKERAKQTKWSSVEDKDETVYRPILEAFMRELSRASRLDSNIPKHMVEYLLGEYDFYKVVSKDTEETTIIQPFNLRGTLNRPSPTKKATLHIPVAKLPNELIAIRMKPDSKNTVELYLNNGWQFSFRIHNASSKVEPSLKFDIQFVGVPKEIVLISCSWNRL